MIETKTIGHFEIGILQSYDNNQQSNRVLVTNKGMPGSKPFSGLNARELFDYDLKRVSSRVALVGKR